MCLGVPGRVEAVWLDQGTRMGTVDFGGVRKEVCLAYVPEVEVGDYTIVHVGFAITRLDEQSALETLELFRSIGALEEELALPTAGAHREASAGAHPEGGGGGDLQGGGRGRP
jgi:hydrogenase expression/formation protein HypC